MEADLEHGRGQLALLQLLVGRLLQAPAQSAARARRNDFGNAAKSFGCGHHDQDREGLKVGGGRTSRLVRSWVRFTFCVPAANHGVSAASANRTTASLLGKGTSIDGTITTFKRKLASKNGTRGSKDGQCAA
eukprot:1875238-Rhodomonas_salina.1